MGCNASGADAEPNVKTDTKQASQAPPPPRSDDISISNSTFPENTEDVKILTLGAGECGKSTLWRQLKRLYCGGFAQTERTGMRRTIRQTIIEDMKNLIDAMEHNSQQLSPELQPLVESIKDLNPNDDELEEESAKAIATIWKDPMMKTVFKSANSIGLGENSAYFLDAVERISEANYLPPDDDILKARIRTVGIAQLQFKIKEIKTILVDVGGQKTERKNWQKCFQGVHYLLFVVSLSDFDQVMFEDGATKRTDDAMNLFNQIANSHIFSTLPIFLVLNKYDVFEKKIGTSADAFRDAYPGFKGNISNISEAIEHVKQAFLQQLNGDRPATAWVDVLFTTAMDQEKVKTVVQKMAKKILDDHQ